jgi:hypothetical protein
MARHENEREDILKEATALVMRAELAIGGVDERIVAGFRRDHSATIFFGQNVVYQFNAAAQLRRVYLDGQLYKAEHGCLVQLRRNRTEAAVELVRHELSTEETAQLLADTRQRLKRIGDAIKANDFKIIGEVPQNGDVVKQILVWLELLPRDIQIASSPGLR